MKIPADISSMMDPQPGASFSHSVGLRYKINERVIQRTKA
jgi:hypothetical protein